MLIYIPGIDGTGELFFRQEESLADSYRVITYRARETGKFSYEDLADDVAAIADDAGADRVTVVAESFGGAVAFNFALRHPARIDRLVIVNSFARFRGRVRIRLAARLAAALPFGLTWYARRAATVLGLLADGVQREDRARVFDALRTVRKEAFVRRLELIAQLDLMPRLHEIKAPTLFIAGDKDLLIPSAREARLMASLVRNSGVRIVAGAGHACLLGKRVVLATMIDEWVSAFDR